MLRACLLYIRLIRAIVEIRARAFRDQRGEHAAGMIGAGSAANPSVIVVVKGLVKSSGGLRQDLCDFNYLLRRGPWNYL